MLNSIRKWNVWVLFRCLVAVFFLSLLLPSITLAQSNTYSGWLSVIYGDPHPGSGEAPRFLAQLSDGQGRLLATLNMNPNLAESLRGQYVEVTATVSEVSAQDIGATTIQVQSIRAIEPPAGMELGVSAAAAESHPYLNLRCYFPDPFDINDPSFAEYPVSYYDQLFQDTYPGLNDYWRQMSYGQIDLNGTVTASNIYMLPHFRSHYIVGGAAQIYAIALDCFAAADASINFHAYSGINVMLNYDLDCCAWGGGYPYVLDGAPLQYFPTTWMPPWGQQFGTLGHEIGHSLGLQHSSGPASNPPDGLNIYISAWDIMSKSSGAFNINEWNPIYGYVPPGTIAYNLDLGGWMPANRKALISPGAAKTITVEQLRASPGSLPPNTYLMAQIPINSSPTHFYTVEVRTHIGYDANIPSFGPQAVVLIFEVDTQTPAENNTGDALIVDVDYPNGSSNGDVNDDGAMWTTGEEFYDSKSGISIAIGALVGTQYSVTIAKESAANAAPVRNIYRTGTPTLRWNQISWAVGYQLQIDDSSIIAFPYTLYANNLPSSQLSFTPSLSIPDGIYYWRVCALKADLTCGSWSVPESFQIDTTP